LAVEAALSPGARERAWSLARAVPVWAWLVGLVALSTAIRYVLTRQTVAPWIMVDELIYSELAKSFAATGHFLVRDHTTGSYGYVYPILIAPAWAVFKAVPDAYAAAKGINSLVMSLACVPAYFLARRVLGQWLALAAAALAVAIPSMVYTATLMTENAFYPLFLTVVLVLVIWLERPTVTNTLVLLGLVLLAYLTRQQAIALVPAILTAPLLLAGREAFRRYQLMYSIVAAGVLVVVVEQLARGRSVFGILGAYQVASTSHYSVGEVTRWFLYHVSELDLSLGVLPFAALLVLAFGLRGLGRQEKVFVAAAVAVSFWLVLEVAIFASEQSFRVEERNMFYVAPLFLIALLVWIDRGLPRGTVWATAAIILAAALPGALPYSRYIGLNAISDTIALLPLGWLVEQGLGLDDVGLVVVFISAAAGLLFLFVPRRYALVLPVLVLVYFAVSQASIESKHHQQSLEALFGGISSPPLHLDWIDRKVGSDAKVAAVWTGNTDKHTIWENELFNRSVGTIYRTGEELPGGLAQTPVTVSRATGDLLAAGRTVRAQYALADTSLALKGTVIGRDVPKRMVLYRVDGPLRQISRVSGLYGDTWSGKDVTYTRLDCTGGTLTLQLQSDPNLFTRPNVVTASSSGLRDGTGLASATVPVSGTTTMRVPLSPVDGRCVVRFHVKDTAVPAVVLGPPNTDTRKLGVHFNRFAYHP
jgi:4-amino-4-deoxy-L-arabinose transferase-like glycosyltransferase